ncbi:MAG TPA: STAS domain-containing protein [Burkholderiales bacterium]|nr:STAS domain-containing protein [Burkholderiales bacterium]
MRLNQRRYGDALVLSPVGRLDQDSSEGFRTELQPLLEGAVREGNSIVLDLSGLEYVSSAGLRCFSLAAKQARAQGSKIVVAGMTPLVAEIFQISRFNMLFDIHPGVREALVAVSPSAVAAYDRG